MAKIFRKYKLQTVSLAVLITGILLASCQRELTCPDCDVVANHPPVACAGFNQTITLPTNIVDLDATCSMDADNNISGFKWTKISGPATFSITNAGVVKTQVSDLIAGIYLFQLKVTDADGLFSLDTVQVTVALDNSVSICEINRPVITATLTPVGMLSQARQGMAVASVNNKIYFAGGRGASNIISSAVDIFDINSQSWSIQQLCIPRYAISAVVAGNKIFFGGGELGDGTWPADSVDIFDAVSNTRVVRHLSLPGSNVAGTTSAGKIFFAGGNGGTQGSARGMRVDIYDLNTDSWSLSTLSEPRTGGHTAITAGGKLYITGGATHNSNGRFTSHSTDIFEISAGTWSKSYLQEAKENFATIVAGNKIYWAGGRRANSVSFVTSCVVQMRDISSGIDTYKNLSVPATWNISAGQNAVLKNNKIVFCSSDGVETDKFDIYDTFTGTWSIGILPFKIKSASVISVNNDIYIAGGLVNNVISNGVWRLDF